ncbi:MAG: selenocysteine-specific translation elongation factor [Streptosporangiales bacterium]
MHVVATAGHVDHGKSTLIRALTGMEPDRLAEEHRRQLTIELGFAWTSLPDAGEVAFVDVPGHERFVSTMLAGIGAVPAVLFVVAADEGWKAQSTEHLEALHALGVAHGLLVVTRADLADPQPAIAQAREQLAGTALRDIPAVNASAVAGTGLDDVRASISALVSQLPPADGSAPVRLWLDRVFTVRGAGTVVTGTLSAGTVAVGDELVTPAGEAVRVRGIETLGRTRERVSAEARVALNVRGRGRLSRGTALLSPDAWTLTDTVDVTLGAVLGDRLPERPMAHLGTLAVPCHARPLGDRHARLSFDQALPLRFGDRVLLRDPGQHRILAGVDTLDLEPPDLRRRGAASARAAQLASFQDAYDVAAHLLNEQPRRGADLRRMGLPTQGEMLVDDWWAAEKRWASLADQLARAVLDAHRERPLERGMPIAAARTRLGLPSSRIVSALARRAGLDERDGLLAHPEARATLPPRVEAAIGALEADLAADPFRAPDAGRLTELGVDASQLAAAERAERVVRVADGIVLLPHDVLRARGILAGLPQPFTASQARQALDTTRRVAVPLLELLASRGITRRSADGRHEVL